MAKANNSSASLTTSKSFLIRFESLIADVIPVIVMSLPDIDENRDLLRRILEHYKYRLENFTGDEDLKPLMSGPVRRCLTFGQLKTLSSQALNEFTEHGNAANLNLPQYSELIRSAINQYVRDLERIKKKSGQELDAKLAELESEIGAANRYQR